MFFCRASKYVSRKFFVEMLQDTRSFRISSTNIKELWLFWINVIRLIIMNFSQKVYALILFIHVKFYDFFFCSIFRLLHLYHRIAHTFLMSWMRRRILFGVFILNGKFDPFTMQITIVIIEGIVISPLAKREREVTRDWETINFIMRTLQCNDTFVALFRSNSLTLDIIIYTLYVGNLNFFFFFFILIWIGLFEREEL